MALAPSNGSSAKRDLIGIALATLAVAAVSVHFELSEALLQWMQRWEAYQVDELPGVLLFLATAMAWFAWRRVRETRAELQRRVALEAALETALEANRRLSRAQVTLQEEERKSIARELHDELGQHLNAIKIDAVSIRDAAEPLPADVQRAADSIVGIADHVHAVIRDLMRRLRPAGLDELGLPAAIENCIDGWRARFPAIAISIAFEGDVDTLGEPLNMALYRLTQEGLTNVTRHAQASRVELRLARINDAVTFTFQDDGAGTELSRDTRGLGLVGMRERIEALGGTLTLDSAPGRGFRIAARFPVVTVAA